METGLPALSKMGDFHLKVKNPQAPMLYSLPKTHKKDIRVGPMVTYINYSPAYKGCKVLRSILHKLLNLQSKYSIKNSLHFAEELKQMELMLHYKLVPFDVKNLFPAVPKYRIRKIIQNMINSCYNLIEPFKAELQKLIETCLDQSYFMFNMKW